MLEKIKKLREKTGAGLLDVREALQKSGGDEKKAVAILRAKGQAKVIKKSQRETKEGVIASYVHSNKKIGVLVELLCETDFVARNSEFQELAKDIAMHIAAMNPLCVGPEDVDSRTIEAEKKIWKEQLLEEKKPAEIQEKIIAGKEKKFREEVALMSQPFVKDPQVTVADLIADKVGKIGENIKISRFTRYEI